MYNDRHYPLIKPLVSPFGGKYANRKLSNSRGFFDPVSLEISIAHTLHDLADTLTHYQLLDAVDELMTKTASIIFSPNVPRVKIGQGP